MEWFIHSIDNKEYILKSIEPESFSIMHYGVKGMKWGVRRYQDKNGRLTAAGKEHYKKGGNKRSSNHEKEYGIGAILAFYGISTLISLAPLIGPAASAGIDISKAKRFNKQCEKEREEAPIDKKSKLKMKTKDLTREEDAKRVNPSRKLDAYKGVGSGSNNNCVNCTMTYEMRRRGYEVQAKMSMTGRNGADVGKSYFKGAKKVSVQEAPKFNKNDQDEFIRYYNKEEPLARAGRNKALAAKTIESIKKNSPPGSRGQICVRWDRNCGHSMAYEVTADGKLNIIDGQIGKVYNDKQAEKLLRRTCSTYFQRLDNCKVDLTKVKEAVR